MTAFSFNRPISFIVFALLLCGALATVAMTPRTRIADTRNHDLERIVPKAFADWTQAEPQHVVLPDPAVRRLQDKVYNVVLTRVYRNRAGDAVMLLIAYGGDQSDALQLHRPEVCYAASGYDVAQPRQDEVRLGGHDIHLTRVATHDSYGHEPVSYWMRVGDRQVTTNFDRQIAKLGAGLRGVVPDGVLVRVSTRQVRADAATADATQDRFIADLLSSLDPATRQLLVGSEAAARS